MTYKTSLHVHDQFDICLHGSVDVLVEIVGRDNPSGADVTLVGEDDESPTRTIDVGQKEAIALRDLFDQIAKALEK